MSDPGKYDREAASYSSRYADPEAIAARQLQLLSSWGRRIRPGARVAELGCADGVVTSALARAGYVVTGYDMSPAMLDVARKRLVAEGLEADFVQADINRLELEDQDAILAQMFTFFSYAHDPVAVLAQFASHAPKVLVDVNPRQTAERQATEALRLAGFSDVASRPFFVPQRYKSGAALRLVLRTAERTPLVRDAILSRKFVVVLKGER